MLILSIASGKLQRSVVPMHFPFFHIMSCFYMTGFKTVILFLIALFIYFGAIHRFTDCEETTEGFACDWSKGPFINDYFSVKAKCEEVQGAVHRSYQSRMSTCIYPNSDAGKECKKAEDCRGFCLVDYEQVEGEYPKYLDDGPYRISYCTACKATCSRFSTYGCHDQEKEGFRFERGSMHIGSDLPKATCD